MTDPTPDTVTCTHCGAAAPVPENRDHAPLWDAGWRWLAALSLYSCPACPSVVTVTPDGRHVAGPATHLSRTGIL
ncbi:hypothetical protein [Streptomyces sp. NPDC097619]|uniref:hypothetical protein n=1 Tax=Streptomyces sp. NPDC097619 TaxID=3157228 RepID=UPI0033335211